MKCLGAVLLWPVLCFTATGSTSLVFEPNRGQASDTVRFVARASGAALSIRDNGFVLHRSSKEGPDFAFQLDLNGARNCAHWQPLDPAPGNTSYLIGTNRGAWIHNVPHFRRLGCSNIYPGIDLALYGDESRLEYDFVLAPGADPGRIRLQYTGVNASIGPNGDLLLKAQGGNIIQKRPYLYQTDRYGSVRRITGQYRMAGQNLVAFKIGRYDHSRSLTIDPVLESASLIGGSGDDKVFGGDPGKVIVGSTTSADFPGVDTGRHSGTDIFIYDPIQHTTIIIGGSGDDIVTCARISPGPNPSILIGGYTNSRDFPVTQTPLGFGNYYRATQQQYGGGDWDGFFLYFYGLTSQPGIASYWGGSGDDRVLAVELGSSYPGAIAVAGSTTSVDLPLAQAWQTTPGGGSDGFAAIFDSLGTVKFSSYLGGSADDRVLAIAAGASGSDFYFGGQTQSNDWQLPGITSGSRSGPSDGFLIHMTGDAQLNNIAVSQSVLLGGPGDDRVTALTRMANGNLAVAGATSSHVFVTQFSADLQKTIWTRSFGGSGSEEPLAIAANSLDEVIVGGWTNSPDLPVVDPLASKCGSGAEDGFLLDLDSTGQTIFATCYGGSGADRITSVKFDDTARVLFSGIGDSPDLPLANAWQAANAGSLDGFYGVISVPIIHAEGVSVGKDLAAAISARLGDTTNFIGTPLTVTTGDPASVLLGIRADDPGQPSVTIANGIAAAYSTNGDYSIRNFRVYCLTTSVVVPLTLSAPGYPTRTVNVRCVPSGLYIAQTDVTVNASPSIVVATASFDPDTMQLLALQGPRGGLPSIEINASTSSPDVVQLGTASAQIDSFASAGVKFSLQTNVTGVADVNFTTPSGFAFIPSNTVHIHTTGPGSPTMNVYVPRLARGLTGQLSVWFSGNSPPSSIPVTITSSDPTKVLFGPYLFSQDQPSLTATYTGPYNYFPAWVKLIDPSGSVSITASAPGFGSLTVPLRFGEVAAAFFYPNASSPAGTATVLLNQSLSLSVRAFVNPIDPSVGYGDTHVAIPRDSAAVQLKLDTSDTSIASSSPDLQPIGTGALSGLQPVAIQGKASGDSVFTINTGSHTQFPMTVHVQSNVLSIAKLTLGYNAIGSLQVSFLGQAPPSGTHITLTSADPSRLLLSLDTQTAGQPSIAIPTNANSVYAQALAGSGTVEVTATAPGYDAVKTTVTLLPSGFAWTAPYLDLSQSPGVAVLGFYALDPANGAALSHQQLRPGLDGAVVLQNSNPDAVTLVNNTVSLSSFDSTVPLTIANGGNAQIALTQPPGYVAPVGRGPLNVKAPRPSITPSATPIGRNTQSTLAVQFAHASVSATPDITITSGDPSKLLISTNDHSVGAASATVRYIGGTYAPIFIQATDGPADLKVTASATGFETGSTIVSIVPTAIVFGSSYGSGGPFNDATLQTNTQTDSVPLTLNTAATLSTGNSNATLRPGLDPISVSIASSNPAVAAVPQPAILNSLTSSAQALLKPLSAGTTNLSVVPPPGFVTPLPGAGRTVFVTVSAPSLTIASIVLGKDLQKSVPLIVQSGAYTIPKNVDVTLVSSDASKVLLSADPTVPGSASLTVRITAGQSSLPSICIQAIDQTGSATIAITAPGYQDSSATATLGPTGFVPSQFKLSENVQTSPYTVQLYPIPIVNPPVNDYSGYQFRAGLPPFALTVSSSNPAVVSISPQLNIFPTPNPINVSFNAVAAGSATISFTAPDPYIAPANIDVQVQGGQFSLSGNSTLGKYLQTSLAMYPSSSQGASVTFTVTSSDPSRALVSASATQPGQASVKVQNQLNQQAIVYVQALADSGSVSITASAAGFQDQSAKIQLAPVAVVLANSYQNTSLNTLSPPTNLTAQLVTYDSNSYGQTLSPGSTPVNVQVTLSNPAVGSVSPAQLTFNPGDSSKTFSFQPLSAGTTLLSLSVPPGFTDPLSTRQQLFTVLAARISFNGTLSAGKDLQKALNVITPSPVAQALSLTLTSADPSRLLLGTSATGTAASSATVIIQPGSATSTAFYLVALDSSGSVGLTVASPPLGTLNYKVTLQPSGFAFSSPPANVTRNSTQSLNLASYSLNPQTLAPLENLALRTGLAPVTVSLTTSDATILGAGTSFTFYPGDAQKYVIATGKTPGVAAITIQTPSGFSTPSSGTTATISVQ